MTGMEGTVGSGNPEVAKERGAEVEDAEEEVDGCPPPGEVLLLLALPPDDEELFVLPLTTAAADDDKLIRDAPSANVDSTEELEDDMMLRCKTQGRGGQYAKVFTHMTANGGSEILFQIFSCVRC